MTSKFCSNCWDGWHAPALIGLENLREINMRWDNVKCHNAIVTLHDHTDKINDVWDKAEIRKLFSVEPPIYSRLQAEKTAALWEKYANGEPGEPKPREPEQLNE